jgi:hypothetical protein
MKWRKEKRLNGEKKKDAEEVQLKSKINAEEAKTKPQTVREE